MSFKIFNLILGSYYANCYIIRDEATGKSAIVDPGFYTLGLKSSLKKEGFEEFEYVLLTHGHYDHILGAAGFKDEMKAKVVIHRDEEAFLRDNSLSLTDEVPYGYKPPKADVLVSDGDVIKLGETEIKVLHTPGHTKGSVCFILGDTIISGDTLFRENVGRWDFPTGDHSVLLDSIRRLYALEGDYTVLPGHNEETTLEHERNNNPYTKGL